MRARDLPGGSRGSVVLLWCYQSCAILQGDTPRPHPTTKGLKAQLAPSVTYSCHRLCLATLLEVAEV